MHRRICLWGFALCVAGMAADRLAAPSKSVRIPELAASNSVPKWERGMFLYRDFDTATLYAYDESGALLMRTPLSIEGADRVNVVDMTVSPHGGFAASGSAWSKDGAGAAFIVWLDSTGNVVRTVRTSPAAAMRVCFASDGTLWALVWVHRAGFQEATRYDVLRHYGADGVLIGSALPGRRSGRGSWDTRSRVT